MSTAEKKDPYKKVDLTTPSVNWSSKYNLVKYEKSTAQNILKSTFYCHIGFIDPKSKRAVVLPRQYGLAGDKIYLHGPDLYHYKDADPAFTSESRLYKLAKEGLEVCVTVSIVDGLGFGRSAIHATLHYRSVVIYGTARQVVDDKAKEKALEAFAEHIAPGYYSKESRAASPEERKQVGIIEIEFDHVSSKQRTGEPRKGEGDPEGKWAGSVSFYLACGEPKNASYIDKDMQPPKYVDDLCKRSTPTVEVTPAHGTEEDWAAGAPL
ncbi:pyridoxamine 5'-phosphate oxidase family protein [Actinokineospora iranica]|uniref:Uncharacterized protein n=1 Tax=Actinokineospora iranica TaxID=1271860 RepID=A0A1G6KL24_9PSEU|nr:pyridoxamine 5'-phosphate oxidase family protein [Actinokineospora iranica]SDC31235.1 hypothetical protein SAMN05216174_101951 [Actinokineospora iranica]